MNDHLKRVTPNKALITAMDLVATKMCETMQKSGDNALKLDDMMDMFSHVTKWVAVRHKIEPEESNNGAGLGNYKSAVKGPPAGAGGSRAQTNAEKRINAGATVDQTGTGLAALKRQLPDAGAGDDDGDDGDDSEPAGGADHPFGINAGRHSVGLSGDATAGSTETDGVRDL